MPSSIMAPRRCGARRSHVLVSTGLTSLAIATWCAEAMAQPVELPVLVVSPTGVPTPIGQVASSVTLITAADIEREQWRTVPAALSTVPGLNVVQAGGPGAQTSVFIRGTNSNHVKVLIDGIDVSDSSNPNQSFDFGQLLTADIERIEVLRGPQSGL
jgi:vitamin B12 transporter